MQQTLPAKKFSWTVFRELIHNFVRTANWLRQEEPFFFYVGIGINILLTIIPFLIAYVSALFINLLVGGSYTSVFAPALLLVAFAYVVLPVILGQLQLAYNYLFATSRVRFEQARDIKLYERLASIDIQTHEDSLFNNLVTKVQENLYRILNFLLVGVLGLITSFVGAVISFVILAHYNILIAIIIFIALLPQLIIQVRYGNRTWGIWGSRAEIRRLYGEYRKPFYWPSGLIELRVYAAKRYFLDAIKDLTALFNGELQAAEKSRFYMQLVAAFGMTMVIGGCTLYLMNDAVTGVLAIGTFIFVVGRITSMEQSMSGLMYDISLMLTDSLFVTDFWTLMDTPRALREGTKMLPGGSTPLIEFSHVSFAYPGSNNPVLHDFDFSIMPGEKIAIVGVNGAGKTTLTKLLMRFYDPTEGTITVDGLPLSDINSDSWLAHIAYLPQDYHSYKLPVGKAIALGNPNIPFDESRVHDAARKAGAHEFISRWSKGYDTPLGKEFDGEEPSVGQWQKLAIARMFYKQANILVLDEPTSSIDAIAELSIFNELENLPDDTSVILISHRFNTVKNADKIIVLEHGTIVEMGTHAELMEKKGHYHTLFTSQKDSYDSEVKG